MKRCFKCKTGFEYIGCPWTERPIFALCKACRSEACRSAMASEPVMKLALWQEIFIKVLMKRRSDLPSSESALRLLPPIEVDVSSKGKHYEITHCLTFEDRELYFYMAGPIGRFCWNEINLYEEGDEKFEMVRTAYFNILLNHSINEKRNLALGDNWWKRDRLSGRE